MFSVCSTRLEHIRSITDPEHPLTLEQLAVVSAPQVEVDGNHVVVEFTPTVPHCGASTLIGKCYTIMKCSVLICSRTFFASTVDENTPRTLQG